MKCFVIGPFGEVDSDVRQSSDALFEEVIKPVAENAGYEAERTIDRNAPGTIVGTIMKGLLTADLVVADLTDANPNVFYELAVRHATARPVIHLTSKLEKMPFDIQDMSFILIKKDTQGRWISKAKSELQSQIDHFKDNTDFPNPVYDGFKKWHTLLSETTTSYEWIIEYSHRLDKDWLDNQSVKVREAVSRYLDSRDSESLAIPDSQVLRNHILEYVYYQLSRGRELRGVLYYDRSKRPKKDNSVAFKGHGILSMDATLNPIIVKVKGSEKSDGSIEMIFFQDARTDDQVLPFKASLPEFEYTIHFSRDSPGAIRLAGSFNHPNCEGVTVGDTYIIKR